MTLCVGAAIAVVLSELDGSKRVEAAPQKGSNNACLGSVNTLLLFTRTRNTTVREELWPWLDVAHNVAPCTMWNLKAI